MKRGEPTRVEKNKLHRFYLRKALDYYGPVTKEFFAFYDDYKRVEACKNIKRRAAHSLDEIQEQEKKLRVETACGGEAPSEIKMKYHHEKHSIASRLLSAAGYADNIRDKSVIKGATLLANLQTHADALIADFATARREFGIRCKALQLNSLQPALRYVNAILEKFYGVKLKASTRKKNAFDDYIIEHLHGLDPVTFVPLVGTNNDTILPIYQKNIVFLDDEL